MVLVVLVGLVLEICMLHSLGSLNHGLGRVTTHNKSISYN